MSGHQRCPPATVGLVVALLVIAACASAFSQVGSALGAACLGAILFGTLSTNLTTAGQAIVELEEIPGMSTAAADAKIAYTDAARTTSFPAALFVGFGLLASCGLPASRTKRGSPTAE